MGPHKKKSSNLSNPIVPSLYYIVVLDFRMDYSDPDNPPTAACYTRKRKARNETDEQIIAKHLHLSDSDDSSENEASMEHHPVPLAHTEPAQNGLNIQNPKKLGKSGWAKNVSKADRNNGKPYTGRNTYKKMSGREVKGPCKCKNQCYAKLGPDRIKTLHEDFWAIENRDLKACHVNWLVKRVEVKRRRTKNIDKQKSTTGHYRLFIKNGNTLNRGQVR